jgi:hypothetical protein
LAVHAPCTILCGVYLIVSSAGRFVEEAYRGEPQTTTLYGLHLYQWIAATCLLAGILISGVQTLAAIPEPAFRWSVLLLGTACGLTNWFVSGVDFPDSSRRFARLT